jgi:hypothetical protein
MSTVDGSIVLVNIATICFTYLYCDIPKTGLRLLVDVYLLKTEKRKKEKTKTLCGSAGSMTTLHRTALALLVFLGYWRVPFVAIDINTTTFGQLMMIFARYLDNSQGMPIWRLASDSSSQTLSCLKVAITQALKIFIAARNFCKAAESVDEGLAERLYAKDGVGVSSKDVDGHMAIYSYTIRNSLIMRDGHHLSFCNHQRQDRAQ